MQPGSGKGEKEKGERKVWIEKRMCRNRRGGGGAVVRLGDASSNPNVLSVAD